MSVKYCVDCHNMDECPNREGLFKCTNRKCSMDWVSARRGANECDFF